MKTTLNNNMPPSEFRRFYEHGYFLCAPMFNKVWCLAGEGCEASAQPEAGKTYFYRNTFDRRIKNPWVTNTQVYEFSVSQFFRMFSNLSCQAPDIKTTNITQEQYSKFFTELHNEILNGNLKKAVPFAQESATIKLNPENLVYFFNAFKKLSQNKTIFTYGYWNFAKSYLQLGASPELLFVKDKHTVQTIALAGTSANPSQEFKTKKILDEHNYVIEDLLLELKRYGKIKKTRTYPVKFKQYFHKKTKISVDCTDTNPLFSDLLKSLYPSAAIGAYPREKGLDFLEKIEKKLNINRGFFASPFGIQTKDNFMLCIGAIRGIEWAQNKLRVTAGGGIVAQSQLTSEWEEIVLKLESIKSIFGLV